MIDIFADTRVICLPACVIFRACAMMMLRALCRRLRVPMPPKMLSPTRVRSACECQRARPVTRAPLMRDEHECAYTPP